MNLATWLHGVYQWLPSIELTYKVVACLGGMVVSIGQGWKVLNILKMISFSNRKASVFNFEGFLVFFFLLLVSSMDF